MIQISKRKYDINYEFFNGDTEEYWYFLGLVSADGYVSDNIIELCLNKKDEYILIKLRDIICPQKPIYDKPSTRSKKFTIHSKKLSQQIKEILSMKTNKKSKEIKFPQVPDNMLKHYIRGLIDGDGCIDTTKAYRDDKVYIGPRLRILGNREYLITMLDEIRKQVPNNTKAVNKKGAENVWYITYNFSTAKDVLHWCYDNNNICINRKYNKFIEVVR